MACGCMLTLSSVEKARLPKVIGGKKPQPRKKVKVIKKPVEIPVEIIGFRN